jgi:hypothetical protein
METSNQSKFVANSNVARPEAQAAALDQPMELALEQLEQIAGGGGEEVQTPRQGW